MKTLATLPRSFRLAMITATLLVMPAGCSGKQDFDGARAMACLTKQVEFGPRVPGTTPHDACRDYLVSELKPNVDTVQLQHFAWRRTVVPSAYRTALKLPRGTAVPASSTFQMDNIVATIKGTDGKVPDLLLCAHWDSRPTADNEPVVADRLRAIPGANDGASGAAVLVELARLLHNKRPLKGVIIVLFDGEDLGPGDGDMMLGADYYAKHPIPTKPGQGILLDMIGDKDLNICRETNSVYAAKDLDATVFATAAKLGYAKQFVDQDKYTMEDDHIPLILNGIPTVDLIDFDFPDGQNMATTYWHTLKDTPDKCSAASLEAVGRTLAAVVAERK